MQRHFRFSQYWCPCNLIIWKQLECCPHQYMTGVVIFLLYEQYTQKFNFSVFHSVSHRWSFSCTFSPSWTLIPAYHRDWCAHTVAYVCYVSMAWSHENITTGCTVHVLCIAKFPSYSTQNKNFAATFVYSKFIPNRFQSYGPNLVSSKYQDIY